MSTLPRTLSPLWIVVAIIAGISALMMIELVEDPTLTLNQILLEIIEPTLIILTVAGVLYLLGRTKRQHQEQLSLIQDIEVARAEGTQWRTDMREPDGQQRLQIRSGGCRACARR